MVGLLLEWYAREARDLPWRRTSDPYSVLVSELMLQQTQVSRVIPAYEAWLERWPTAEALAAARREDVLAAWVGLGYNRRALALWQAAGIVARDGWPEDLRLLPGVGPYTAAAVGSFAFGRQVVAVDVNVARVRERFGAPLEPPGGRAGDFNQAMMELGATVCTARTARCGACPIAGGCASAGQRPVRPARRAHRPRFEDTNRWVRGRIVAALAAGEGLPQGIAPERLEPALDGLVRDGLVRRSGGTYALG
ncbi:MAG: A/G-specific adenine glycosylase [Solirubrobacteraceae bacterium]